MKHITIALAVTLSTFAVAYAAKNETSGRGLRGGQVHYPGELLNEDTMQSFKESLGLKVDYKLPLQKIEPYGDFEVGDEVLSFDYLQLYSVESDSMASVTIDNIETPIEAGERIFLGESPSGRSILAITDLIGRVQDIEVTDKIGSITLITEVFETGVYATIPTEAYDFALANHGPPAGLDYEIKKSTEEEFNRMLHRLLPGVANEEERELQSGCSAYRNIELAIAFDSSFCSEFGGASKSISEVNRIMATASSTYWRRPGLCVNLKVVHIEGYCNAASDPYNQGSILSGCDDGPDGMMDYFSNYWNDNRKNVVRDVAHLFRVKRFIDYEKVAGCAYVGGLCNQWAYGINDFTSYRTVTGRAYLMTHELGHNGGSIHQDGGLMERGNTEAFSQTSINKIRNKIAETNCVGTIGVGSLTSGTVLQGSYTMQQKSTVRYVDAYTISTDDSNPVVTRTAQGDSTQRWKFTPVGFVMTVQQTTSGLYMDAYESGSFSVVNRAKQNNPSQEWIFFWDDGWNPNYRIQQFQTRRYLDASEASADDHNVFTNSIEYNDSQRWKLIPKGSDTYMIQQKSSGRYLDAYPNSSNDYNIVTRAAQTDGSQNWRLRQVGVVYRIQQEANGRYLDSWNGGAYEAHTRARENNDSQLWVAFYEGSETYTLRQLANGRYLDAFPSSNDHRVVTRDAQNDDSQRWLIKKVLNS